MQEAKPDNLWHNRGFVKLWSGQTISFFGSEITKLAMSLTAINLLGANPLDMGFLTTASFAPALLFGLVAGVWVDRFPRRPILLIADFGRAGLLAVIPLIYCLGQLKLEYLYFIAFSVGCLDIFFAVSYRLYMLSLVSRVQLVAGNSWLEFSQAIVKVSASGFVGILIQVLSAPIAIILDALSFIISGIAIMLIKEREEPPADIPQRNIGREIWDGIKLIKENRFLSLIVKSTALNAFFLNIQGVVFVLYLSRDLGLNSLTLGIIFSVGSVGSVVGSLVTRRLNSLMGIGPNIIMAHLLYAFAILLLPAAGQLTTLTIPLLISSNLLFGFAFVVKSITVVSFRQAITPAHLQGRATASVQFLTSLSLPIGSLIGGLIASGLGLPLTITFAGIGSLATALWLTRSPLNKIQNMPQPPSPLTEVVPAGTLNYKE